MKDNIVKNKSFSFAIRTVNLCRYLSTEKKEYIISKQLLRSGTAIGALVRESEHAESKADFIHKLSIALKEGNEAHYWIELLHKTDYISINEFQSMENDVKELIKLLVTIIKSSKQKK
ncbi:MAG: four helix bundle protein [Bacteroidia bacterium]